MSCWPHLLTLILCPDRPWAKWSFPGNLNVIEVLEVLLWQTSNISSYSSRNCHRWTGWQPTPLTLIESCAKSSKNEFNFCICSKNLADNIDLHIILCPLYNGPEKKFHWEIKFLFDSVTELRRFLKSLKWTMVPSLSWMPGSSDPTLHLIMEIFYPL